MCVRACIYIYNIINIYIYNIIYIYIYYIYIYIYIYIILYILYIYIYIMLTDRPFLPVYIICRSVFMGRTPSVVYPRVFATATERASDSIPEACEEMSDEEDACVELHQTWPNGRRQILLPIAEAGKRERVHI